MNSNNPSPDILVLGIGNVLMGDEGVGVHAVHHLRYLVRQEGIHFLDGGTGSFLLLEPMQQAKKIILIDATIDGANVGTVRRLQPRFSKDYPRTLTAHDIGLKDLLDAFYLLGRTPDVILFAISIPPLQEMQMELSPEIRAIVPQVGQLVMDEIAALKANLLPASRYSTSQEILSEFAP